MDLIHIAEAKKNISKKGFLDIEVNAQQSIYFTKLSD